MAFDTEPPVFSSAQVIGKELTVQFNELLDSTLTSMSGSKWTVKAGSRTVKVRAVEISSKTATATLFLDKSVDINDTVLVSYKDLANDESFDVIQDLELNDLESFVDKAVRNETMPDEDLDIVLSEIDGDKIVIGFDREIDINSIPNTGMFRIFANKKRFKATDISVNSVKREATITLASPVSGSNDVLLNYIDAKGDQSDNVIQDIYGNDLATFKKLSLDNLTDGGSFDPPAVLKDGVILDGKTLEIAFDEDLMAGTISRKRFIVRAGKKRVKVNSASVTKGESYVVCELKDVIPPMYVDREITVSYRDLKGDNKKNVIQDLSGSDAETFKNIPVELI